MYGSLRALRRNSKKRLRKKKRKKYIKELFGAVCLTAFVTGQVYALPEGGEVVAGQASIIRPSSVEMLIKQVTDKAIINWSAFNIARNELVRFNQPSSIAVALNRVIGQNPSEIFGKLIANGRVFLINPNGIIFGKTAEIDVAGFLATTLDIKNKDFLNKKFNFKQLADKDLASIINQGKIKVTDNGFVMLVAPSVKNKGFIYAKLGKVVLASGTEYKFDFLGNDLITYSVLSPVKSKVLDSEGNQIKTGILNKGIIKADGSTVILTARAAEDVFSSVVNNEGIIEAKSLVLKGGKVILEGGNSGKVENSGIIDVSSAEEGAQSGKISITGETVDNSGKILANGLDNSNAGFITLFSTRETTISSTSVIEAKGKGVYSQGGFIEVSSKGTVNLAGVLDVSSDQSFSGSVIIDPKDVTITSNCTGGGDFIVNADNSITIVPGAIVSTRNVGSTNPDVQETAPSIGDSGDIKFTAPNITIGENANLLTFADNGYSSGAIVLNATESSNVKIDIGKGAVLKGGDVRIIAKADSSAGFGFNADDSASQVVLSFLNSALSNGTENPDYYAYGGLIKDKASSTITVSEGVLIEGSKITISSKASSSVDVMVVLPKTNASYANSEADSEIDIKGKISSTGDIDISSYSYQSLSSHSEVAIEAQEGRNANNFYISIAYGKGDLKSKINVEDTAIIEGSSVNISSTADREIFVQGKSGAYKDGTRSGAVAVADLSSDIETTIAGTIKSNSGNIGIISNLNTNDLEISTGASSGTGLITRYTSLDYNVDAKGMTKFVDKISPGTVSNSKSSKLSFSASLTYINSSSTIKTKILSGAVLNSASNLNTEAICFYDRGNLNLGASASVNNNDESKKDYSAAGALLIAKLDDDIESHVYSGATLDAGGDILVHSKIDIPYGGTYKPYNGDWDSIKDVYKGTNYYKDETINFIKDYVAPNSKVMSTSGGEVVGIAGMVNITHFSETSKAIVDNGVSINNSKNTYSKVTVKAESNIVYFNVAGDLAGELKPTDKSAVGGAYSDFTLKQITEAFLGGNVNATAIDVNANAKDFLFSLGIAGGTAQKFALNAGFSWIDLEKETKAGISSGSILNVGNDLLDGSNSLLVDAFDESKVINVLGGIVVGHSVGIGASAVFNKISRDTEAYISGTITTSSDIKVEAENSGLNLGITIAGTVVTQDKFAGLEEDDPLDGYSIPNLFEEKGQTVNPQSGLAVVFAGAINDINDTTKAYADDLTLLSPDGSDFSDLTLSAIYNTGTLAIGGTAAVSTTEGTSAGLNGAFMAHYQNIDTEAYVLNSNLNVNNLDITAKDSSYTIAIGAGGAISSSDKSGALVGTVTKNDKEITLFAYVSNSTLNTQGNATVEVSDTSRVASAGVDISSASLSAGASIALNTVNGTESAYIENSDVSSNGTIFVNSDSKRKLYSVTTSASANGKNYLLAAASVSINQSNIKNQAYIKGKKTSDGGIKGNVINIKANDDNSILVIAGSLTQSGEGLGLGTSFAYNKVSDTASAWIENTNVQSSTLKVDSEMNSDILDISISGGISKVGVGFNVVVNDVENQIDAHISNSTVSTSGTTGVVAYYYGKNQIYGGVVQAGSFIGIGGTGTGNIIKNSINAYIYNSTITAQGNTSLDIPYAKDSNLNLSGVAVVSSGKEKLYTGVATASYTNGGYFNFDGSASVDKFQDNTQAYIKKTKINTNKDTNVKAYHEVDSKIGDGGLAVNPGGVAGIGVSAGAVVLKDNTSAYIDNSDVYALGTVNVSSETVENLLITAIAGSAMNQISIAGSIGFVFSNETNSAFINDSTIQSGSVKVNASDSFNLRDGNSAGFIIGALSATLGPAGVGGGVGVINVKNKTYSYIAGSTIGGFNTSPVVEVTANATKDIYYAIANVAAERYLGLSGSVGVISIGTKTEAFIGSSSDKSLSITASNVNISSTDTIKLEGGVGNAAGSGGASVGAAVNVISIHSYNNAFIGDNSSVTASSINISAETKRDVNVKTIGFGGGLVGVQGTVSVINIGSALDSDEAEAIGGTSEGVENSITSPFSFDTGLSEENKQLSDGLEGGDISDDLSTSSSPSDLTAAAIGKHTTINLPKGNLNITSKNEININSGVGGGALGVLSVGGSVNIVRNYANSEAYIGDNSKVNIPSGVINIYSTSSVNATLATYAGAGGSVTLGAAISYFYLGGDTLSFIGTNSSLKGSEAYFYLESSSSSSTKIQSIGTYAGVSFVAGAVITKTTIQKSAKSYLKDRVHIGEDINKFKKIQIEAHINDTLDLSSLPVNVGAVSTDASVTSLFYSPTVYSYLGNEDILYTNSNITISSDLKYNIQNKATGIDIGMFTAGASISGINISSDVETFTGNNTDIHSDGSVTFSANIKDGAKASATATSTHGGALLGATGSKASITYNAMVKSEIGNDNTFDVKNSLDIFATDKGENYAYSTGLTGGGILAFGLSFSNISFTSTVSTSVGDNSQIKVSDGDINIQAESSNIIRSQAVAGIGGVVSGDASKATTSVSGTTSVSTGTSSKVHAKGTIKISSTRSVDFNSFANSRNASIAGKSGAYAANTVKDEYSRITIGNSSKLEAFKYEIVSLNKLDKFASSILNADEGSGGVVEGVASYSSTKVSSSGAEVILQDNANLKLDGDFFSNEDVLIKANNLFDFNDKAKLSSGGLIDLANAESSIEADNNIFTKVEIGKKASIDAMGNVIIAAATRGSANVEAMSYTYGGGSYADGSSKASFSVWDKVYINSEATIKASHSVSILAGADDISDGYLKTHAYTDIYNKALVPFEGTPDADAYSVKNAVVTISSGALIQTGYDINITATKGNLDAYGFGKATDVYKEALKEIKKWFGDDDGSVEKTAGTSYTSGKGNIYVEGNVETGLYRHQYVTFEKDFDPGFYVTSYTSTNGTVKYKLVPNTVVKIDGVWKVYDRSGHYIKELNIEPDKISNGISWNLVTDFTIEKNLNDRIQKLKELETIYGGDSATKQDIDTEIKLLEAELQDPAMYQTTHVIKIGTVYASSGDINIRADNIYGSGSLKAPGDVRIDITNKSPLPIEVGTVLIPWNYGGHVRLNGISVHKADDIAKINISHIKPNISITDGENSSAPVINIRSSYKKNLYTYDPNGNPLYLYPPPILVGYTSTDGSDSGETYIKNMGGKVNIESSGSIIVTEGISANTIRLDAGGNFIFNDPSANYLVLGSPESQFNLTASSAQNLISSSDEGIYGDSKLIAEATHNNKKYFPYADSLNAINPYSGYTIAGNNIFINAEIVDINGVIQSGIPDREVVITYNPITHRIFAKYSGNYKFFTFEDNEPVIAEGIDAELKNGKIYISDVDVQGGTVFISGRIINTGNSAKKGWINVVDGYGKINITNLTPYPIVIKGIDTGGIEGKIILIDKNIDNTGKPYNPDTSKYYYVIEYKRLGNTIYVYDNLNRNSSTPTRRVKTINGRITDYQPLEGIYYYWTAGTTSGKKRITKYHHEYDKWLGVVKYNDLKYEESWKTSDYTIDLDKSELPVGNIVGYYSDYTQPYYIKHKSTKIDGDTTTQVNVTTKWIWKWYGPIKHTVVDWKVTHYYTQNDYYFNYVKANYPIRIHFIGYDKGKIDISSNSGIVIDGIIRNPQGVTTIKSATSITASNLSLIQGDQINLTANTIGTSNDPVKVTGAIINESIITPKVTIEATSDINLQSVNSDLQVSSIITTGDVNIVSDKNLVIKTYNPFDSTSLTGAFIKGKNIYLNSKYGNISASNRNFINVDIDAKNGGRLTVLANTGDLRIRELTGDLNVYQIKTSGDVYIEVPFGDLVDVNPNEKKDDRTINQLKELWNELGLTGDASQQLQEEQIKAYNRMMEAQYQSYWRKYRNLKVNSDGSYSYSPYEPVQFKLSDKEIDALKSAGWTDDMIADYENKMTDFYNKWGHENYNPNFTYNVKTDDPDQYKLLTDNSWADRQLEHPLPSFLFKKNVTDTVYMDEDPNIVGNNVYLFTGKSIGIDKNDIIYNYADPNSIPENEREKVYLALAAAEIGDVKIDTDKKEIIIHQRDDIDVKANGKVTAIAGEHVYLGSDSNIEVHNLYSRDDWVRLKVYGDILASAGILNVSAPQGLILEAANGKIGTKDIPLSIYLKNGSPLVARAQGDINLFIPNGNLYVGYIYTPSALTLSVPNGIIHDWSQDVYADINVDSAIISAVGIGDAGGLDKALNIDLNSGDLNIYSTGNVNISSDYSVNLKDGAIKGTLSLLTFGNLDVKGNVLANSVELTSYGNVNVEPSSRIFASKGHIFISGNKNLSINGVLSANDWLALKTQKDISISNSIYGANSVTITGGGNSNFIQSGGKITSSSGFINILEISQFTQNKAAGISAPQAISVNATGDLRFSGYLYGGNISLSSSYGSISLEGPVEGFADLLVSSYGNIKTTSNVWTYSKINFKAQHGYVYIKGGVYGAHSVDIIAGEDDTSDFSTITIEDNSLVASIGDIYLKSSGSILNKGNINSDSSINITSKYGNIELHGNIHSSPDYNLALPADKILEALNEAIDYINQNKNRLIADLSSVNDNFNEMVNKSSNIWKSFRNYISSISVTPYFTDTVNFVFNNDLQSYLPAENIPLNQVIDIVSSITLPNIEYHPRNVHNEPAPVHEINISAFGDIVSDAFISTGANISISGNNINLKDIIGGGDVKISSIKDISIGNSTIIYSGTNIELNSGNKLDTEGYLLAGGSVKLISDGEMNVKKDIFSAGNILGYMNSLSIPEFLKTIVEGGENGVEIKSNKGINIDANIVSLGKVKIKGDNIDIKGILGGNKIKITSQGDVTAKDTLMYGGTGINFIGDNINFQGIMGSDGEIGVNGIGSVSVIGAVYSFGNVKGTMDFSGIEHGVKDLIKKIGFNDLSSGIDFSAGDNFDLNGEMITDGKVGIKGNGINISGIIGGEEVNIDSGNDYRLNKGGIVFGFNRVNIKSDNNLEIEGAVLSSGNIKFQSGKNSSLEGFVISATAIPESVDSFVTNLGRIDVGNIEKDTESIINKSTDTNVIEVNSGGDIKIGGFGIYGEGKIIVNGGGNLEVSSNIYGAESNFDITGLFIQDEGKIEVYNKDVKINTGSMIQNPLASIISLNGKININSSKDNIEVSYLEAKNGNVLISSSGAIYNRDRGNIPKDYDIYSPEINLTAETGIGAPNNVLNLKTSKLTASTIFGGIYVSSDGDLRLENISAGSGDIYAELYNGNLWIDSTIEARGGGIILKVPQGFIMGDGRLIATNNSLLLAGKYVGLPFKPLDVNIKAPLNIQVFGKDSHYGFSTYIKGSIGAQFQHLLNVTPGLTALNNVTNGGKNQDEFFFGTNIELQNTSSQIFKYFPALKKIRIAQDEIQIDKGSFNFKENKSQISLLNEGDIMKNENIEETSINLITNTSNKKEK